MRTRTRWSFVVATIAAGLASARCSSFEEAAPSPPPADAVDAATNADGGGALDARADASCTSADGGKRMFITTSEHQGDVTVGEADTICAAAARSAGFCGTFVAWLSFQGLNAEQRIDRKNRFVDPTGAVVFPPGTLASKPGAKYPSVAADGTEVSPLTKAWTGTKSDGQFSTVDCAKWMSAAPSSQGTAGEIGTANWTDALNLPCNERARLYCFEK